MKKDLPKTAKKLAGNHLAEGEATGHFHAAVGTDVTVFDLGDGVLVLDAPEGATVEHQEHGPITLPPGLYDRHIVKEYDHAAEEARNVQD
ncbi:hypothetical protein M0R72_10135 [Candidatus Pacearchaeota archaeon]|jgi:hypothetical protein|nr:hypothetical protein [Candidatus Pacearchaeota archaeon]